MTTRPLNEVTEAVIGGAIAVHRALGPGLLESTYVRALCIELEERRLCYQREVALPVVYHGRTVGTYRIDLVVEEAVVVEVKSVAFLNGVFEAQLLAYLRVTGKQVGLLINFNSPLLKDGIRRFINS